MGIPMVASRTAVSRLQDRRAERGGVEPYSPSVASDRMPDLTASAGRGWNEQEGGEDEPWLPLCLSWPSRSAPLR